MPRFLGSYFGVLLIAALMVVGCHRIRPIEDAQYRPISASVGPSPSLDNIGDDCSGRLDDKSNRQPVWTAA